MASGGQAVGVVGRPDSVERMLEDGSSRVKPSPLFTVKTLQT